MSEPAAAAPPPTARRADRWVAAGLFALLAAVYALGPERELHDARYALTTAESLVAGRGWDLRPSLGRRADSPEPGRPRRKGFWGRAGHRFVPPYQLVERDGRWIYFFPPGTPLLSTPFAAAARLAGLSTLDERGLYRYRREERQQGALAALLAAATAVILFRASRRDLPAAAAAGVALAAGLGTSLFSVASRNLWSHSWSVLVGAAIWLELARWEDGERRRPAWLAALLVASFWIRPVDGLVVVAVTAFVAVRHRVALPRLVAVGLAGLAAFVLFSLALWREALPPYYLGNRIAELRFDEIPAAVAGLLLSPTRGLVSFTPLLLVVAWLLARRGAPPARRALVALALAIVVSHLLFYAVWENWRAIGATYGPRLLTDVVPWLALLGAAAWRAERESTVARVARPVALAVVAALSFGWSLLSHAPGAYSPAITEHVARSARKSWSTPADWVHAPAARVLARWGRALAGRPPAPTDSPGRADAR